MNFKYLPHLNSAQNLGDRECPLVRGFNCIHKYISYAVRFAIMALWHYGYTSEMRGNRILIRTSFTNAVRMALYLISIVVYIEFSPVVCGPYANLHVPPFLSRVEEETPTTRRHLNAHADRVNGFIYIQPIYLYVRVFPTRPRL